MNQTQRKFLIDKIQESVKSKIKAMEDGIPEAPSINNYLLHAVMSGKFEIRSTEEIRETLLKKALNAKGNEDWLGNHWGMANKTLVAFRASEIFVLPAEYQIQADECRAKKNLIGQQVRDLRIQADTLITRIQLASDKTLQAMINEIDDMGNISLMDTKLKGLASGYETALLE